MRHIRAQVQARSHNATLVYVGVAQDCIRRFFEEPGPHRRLYSRMHVLAATNAPQAASLEIETLYSDAGKGGPATRTNSGTDGERVFRVCDGKLRFVYVCIKD